MAKRNDAQMAVIRRTGPATWLGNRFWHHPWLVRDALCEDGRRRTVYLNQDADTFFSWPGRTKIAGKSVTGFAIQDDDGDDTRFLANKNPPRPARREKITGAL